ncbi:MAG TPA: PASTA domain-containing protein, partial [Candidatus Limnocylindrales bacterium]|nr:PASTA domain-containing protein [Candidatus Limnocylindrales bacterium]
RVKVVDFGIARAVAEAQVTLPGTTLGSVHYFSPEQARGEPTTAASDIFSLGIVLYEMLTGVRPWTGDSAASVALARLSGPIPDPMVARSSLPPDLAAITRKALSLAPDDRFSSAGAMADALDATLASREGMVGASALSAASAAGATSADRLPEPPGAPSIRPAAVGPVISGTARSNPVRVPYPPEAYAGEDGEDGYPPAGSGRRPGARPAAARPTRYEEGDDDRGGTSPLVWLTGIIAIILLAAVAFVVFQFASGANPGPSTPGTVTVPNFVGDDIAAATREAESLGITLTPTDQESTERAGTILSQEPAEGRELQVGGEVKVQVAQPAGTVTVPELRLGSEVDAITKLFAAGLTRGTKTEAYDPVVPLDLIISQDPFPGASVPRDTPVNYVVSLGPEPTPSPSPTPTPTPTPEPTPPPTPTPTPEPTPTPTPEPTPPPTPTPEVTPAPVPPIESPAP